MALDPESYLSTPAGYASPQQLETARQIAAALIRPQQGEFMQSRLQPAARIVNALLGVKMMQQADAQQRSMAGAGLPLGSGSPLSQPGAGQPGPLSGPVSDQGGPEPASIRFNNPGAQYPGASASKFGSTGYGVIGGGQLIAQFPDAESGAAAQFDLLANRYSGMRLADAIHKWSGGNSSAAYTQNVSRATGLSPDTVLTKDLIADPNVAVPLAKSMAQFETGKPYPLSDQQWASAHARAMSGASPQVAEGGPVRPDAPSAAGMSFAAPSSPAGAQTQPPVPPTGPGPQPTPGTPTTQQTPNGAPPPQLFRQMLITPQMIYAARLSQDPMYPKMMEMYLQQQMPQEMKFGDRTFRYIPAHPEIAPVEIPQPHQFKEFGGDGVPKYPGQIQQTPQGWVQSPVPMAGAPSPSGQPPAAAPSAAPSNAGGGIQTPTDFPSAVNAATQITGAKKQAELDATTHNKIYTGIVGTAVNAAEQQQNINLAQAIMADPSYPVGGTGGNFSQAVKTALATTGIDPNAATPRKIVEMLGARIFQQQLSSMKSASSEVGETAGRIFARQIDIEEKALINANDPDPVIRAKLNVLNQEGQLAIQRAKMAHEWATTHGGRIDSDFVQRYIESTAKQRMTPPPPEPTPESTSRAGGFSRPLAPSGSSGSSDWISLPSGASFKRIDQ